MLEMTTQYMPETTIEAVNWSKHKNKQTCVLTSCLLKGSYKLCCEMCLATEYKVDIDKYVLIKCNLRQIKKDIISINFSKVYDNISQFKLLIYDRWHHYYH